jgi:hypothetical protein
MTHRSWLGLFVLCAPTVTASSVSAQIPIWNLVEEIRIGALDGPHALSEVGSVVPGADGSIYVAQPQEGLIRVFDRSGRLVRTLGGRGSGPGEFQRLSDIGWHDEKLYASDATLYRITLFSPDGVVEESLRVESAIAEGAARPGPPKAFFADGTILSIPGPSLRQQAAPLPILRIDRTGKILDTVGLVRRPPRIMEVRAGGRSMQVLTHFFDSSLNRLAPDGSVLWIVDRSSDAGGETTIRRVEVHPVVRETAFRLAFRTERIPPEERERLIEDRAELFVRMGLSPRAARQAVVDQMELPEFEPAVSEIAASTTGELWLRRQHLGHDRVWWALMGPGGTLRGRVLLPADVTVQVADEDHLWTLEHDEFDVPYVVRYRIERDV